MGARSKSLAHARGLAKASEPRPSAITSEPRPPGSGTKKLRLAAWLEERKPERIDDSCWNELKSLLAPVSEPYLRKLIRGSGIAMSPLVEGVNQEDLSNLERTLLALEHEYSGGNTDRGRLCRACVITAKDHLKWRLRRLPADSPERHGKEEAMLWLMTWLENPGLFPSWLSLRKKLLAGGDSHPPSSESARDWYRGSEWIS